MGRPLTLLDNVEALQIRTCVGDTALNQLIQDFEMDAQVEILDASNTTEARRSFIHQVLTELGIKVIFLECLYGEEVDQVDTHVSELRLTIPEYDISVSDEEALSDFKARINNYRRDYVTLCKAARQDLAYIQIFDGGDRIVVNQISGFLPAKILFYLMNLRHASRSIYLCQAVAQPSQLARILAADAPVVWTDISPAATALSQPLRPLAVRVRSTLSRLNLGIVEDLAEDQVQAQHPAEHKRHCQDPYHHRFPRAESYHDLVVRLEPIIMELERDAHSILIVADATVLRCIYAYYIEASPFVIPSLVLDPAEVILLQPMAYGCSESRFSLDTAQELRPKIFRQYGDS